MKKLLVITCVLLSCLFARSQPLADLIGDVQAHKSSLTGLMALFSKHPSYNDETDYTPGYNGALLGQRMKKADFHYTLADSIVRRMVVQVIYKNDQVGYIKIEGERYDSSKKQEVWQVAWKYVDTLYTNQVLTAYNNKHQTQFTWTDLYEDNCMGFTIRPGELVCQDYSYDPHGNVIEPILISPQMKKEFYPLIKKRDHNAIIKNCQSFNSVRKAYGAVCLYVLQYLGEPLSKKEKHLLKKCRRSREKIVYMEGDKWDIVKIRSLLRSNRHMREQCYSLKLPNLSAALEF
jgi:hypothetical protein